MLIWNNLRANYPMRALLHCASQPRAALVLRLPLAMMSRPVGAEQTRQNRNGRRGVRGMTGAASLARQCMGRAKSRASAMPLPRSRSSSAAATATSWGKSSRRSSSWPGSSVMLATCEIFTTLPLGVRMGNSRMSAALEGGLLSFTCAKPRIQRRQQEKIQQRARHQPAEDHQRHGAFDFVAGDIAFEDEG